MTALRLIWKELRERPGQLATSFLAISLGITVIVAIKTVAHFYEKAVARELDDLGANVLVLPKNEFKSKAAWAAGSEIFRRPEGCGTAPPALSFLKRGGKPKKTSVRRTVTEDLAADEVLVGSEVAPEHGLQPGATLKLNGHTFTVRQVLPETGAVDDSRVFAHLHTVQRSRSDFRRTLNNTRPSVYSARSYA